MCISTKTILYVWPTCCLILPSSRHDRLKNAAESRCVKCNFIDLDEGTYIDKLYYKTITIITTQ